ncbi:MAG: hypothetical protein M0Z94_08570, partial [Dehalococcoidales bacterium]|nr:hypothetical protein [Dehalococcoidales bacterium]
MAHITLQERLTRALEEKNDLSPLDLLSISREILRPACGAGGEADPLGDNASDGHYAYMKAANLLEANGLFPASEALLLEWWNDFGARQRAEKVRVYRAVIAYKLAELYLRWDSRESALWWALHIQADDMLGEHERGGGAGKQQLRTVFGMSEPALEELNQVARDCLTVVKNGPNPDWSQPEGYPEEVVRQFASHATSAASLLASTNLPKEHPLSTAYFSALLDRLSVEHKTSNAKGEALENLASYLFLLLPGCVPRRNLLDQELAFESDVVIRNLAPISNLAGELLGRHFLAECKNWNQRIGVRDVGYFLFRMHLAHASF